MQCESVQKELVSFHFGTPDVKDRAPIEAHLSECRECLLAYFSLKGHFELELDESCPTPSPRLKARLAAEVAELFPPKRSDAALGLRSPKRPRFLSYGSAVAVTALAVLFFVVTGHHYGRHGHRDRHRSNAPVAADFRDSIDSASQEVENLNFL